MKKQEVLRDQIPRVRNQLRTFLRQNEEAIRSIKGYGKRPYEKLNQAIMHLLDEMSKVERIELSEENDGSQRREEKRR